eukprot:m.60354 g.60354  ORF g.60354 m.60354 type:complete len:57 (+) comp17434_c0_seq1:281-451(+)
MLPGGNAAYLIGGTDGGDILGSVERFAGHEWTLLESELVSPRRGCCAAVLPIPVEL